MSTVASISAYTRARIIACKGQKFEMKIPRSRWEIHFVPLSNGRCKEVAVSVSGEVNEGFTWKWSGAFAEGSITISGEDREKHKEKAFGEWTGENKADVDQESRSAG